MTNPTDAEKSLYFVRGRLYALKSLDEIKKICTEVELSKGGKLYIASQYEPDVNYAVHKVSTTPNVYGQIRYCVDMIQELVAESSEDLLVMPHSGIMYSFEGEGVRDGLSTNVVVTFRRDSNNGMICDSAKVPRVFFDDWGDNNQKNYCMPRCGQENKVPSFTGLKVWCKKCPREWDV